MTPQVHNADVSIKVVHEEIKRFLEDPNPEVLCLKGKWGVGKTYAWNYYLQEAIKGNKIALKKYAYVSLFGLKNLEDVKYALFESTTSGEALITGSNQNSIEKGFEFVANKYRKAVAWLTKNPVVQSYIGQPERSLFYFIRNQIVCIDDLERAGGDLNSKDIFGLISYLKEQKNCKVAILLNEEKLSEDDKKDYDKFLEKVIDTKLDFSPTPQEAADIVFPSPEGIKKLIHKNCVTLGITNIRVIKKIERIVLRFEEIFGKDGPLMFQVAHSATLLGWSVYQPDIAPPFDFLNDISRIHGIGRDKEKISDDDKIWQELLRNYNYSNTDEFDLKILETIRNGYFDREKLKAAADKQLKIIDETNSKNEFDNAWNLYHDSFEDNEKEVLDALYSSAKKNAKFIEPMNLDSTVVFLRQFGRDKEASDLIKHYVNIRSDEEEVFDFERSLFSRDLKDQELIAALKNKRETFIDSRDPVQVLADIATNRGWNPEDITLISKLTVDNFYKIFKDNKSTQLHRVIRAALDFGRFSNATEEMRLISQNATAALKKIGGESKLNAKRVATQGIQLEKSDSAV